MPPPRRAGARRVEGCGLPQLELERLSILSPEGDPHALAGAEDLIEIGARAEETLGQSPRYIDLQCSSTAVLADVETELSPTAACDHGRLVVPHRVAGPVTAMLQMAQHLLGIGVEVRSALELRAKGALDEL